MTTRLEVVMTDDCAALELLKDQIRRFDTIRAVDETALALVGAPPEKIDEGIARLLKLAAGSLAEAGKTQAFIDGFLAAIEEMVLELQNNYNSIKARDRGIGLVAVVGAAIYGFVIGAATVALAQMIWGRL